MKQIALLAGILALGSSLVHAADPEMRACWISRFEWPSSNEATCRARIQTMMQTLKDNNFNAVLFQVRGECDTLYPNPYEPWAPQFSWNDPGWDPVAFAVEEAHARGLEFHAYINTHTMISSVPPDPTVPQHVYNLYGKTGASPNWQIAGEDGQPAGQLDSYVWLAPGIPDAEAWTRRAILYVVTKYNVDGVHFDRIRTPASSYSHDPISQARFEGEGNPDGLEWGDWMRSQITRQLRNIYGAVNQVKPNVKITCAPFGICKKEPGGYQGTGTESYYSWYQDSFGWMENHVVDAIFPMIYWDIGSAHPFEVLLADFLHHTGGRHVYAGSTTARDEIAQVYETRRQGAPGNCIFSYTSTPFADYLNGPYSEPAPVPEMPWKTHPTTGIIVGYVRDLNGNPLTDAYVKIDGDSYTYLSSGDGFYSIVDAMPGTRTLQASKNMYGRDGRQVELAAGQVIQVDFVLRTSGGMLGLDKSIYRMGETIHISLTDHDLAGSPTVTIQASSATEQTPEVVTLATTDGHGAFAGSIILQSGPPAPADGALQAAAGDTLTFTYFDAFDGTGPSTVVATATADAHVVIFEELLDHNPGWTAQGGGACGAPQGAGGDAGNPDPTTGFTGANVYGYNLAGPYESGLAAPQYLISPAINASRGHATLVSFARWLNVEANTSDQAAVEVSNDGALWYPIWQNPTGNLTDSAWSVQEFDISKYADFRPRVFIRWAMGPTSGDVNYTGWNLDDIHLYQIPGGAAQFIIDNDEPGFSMTGLWSLSTQGVPYGTNKRYHAPGTGTNIARWNFTGIPAGKYTVEFWINDNNYAENAEYRVWHDAAPSEGERILASQNFRGDGWQTLGTFTFTSGAARIQVSDAAWTGAGIYVVADAMRITPASSPALNGAWILY